MRYWYDQVLLGIAIGIIIHVFKFYFLKNEDFLILLIKYWKNRKTK